MPFAACGGSLLPATDTHGRWTIGPRRVYGRRMRTRLRRWTPIALALCLCACDQRSPDVPPDPGAKEKARVEQDIARTEDGIRIAIAEKRIAQLEKTLAEIQVTPESVEIDLLKKRLEAVEAKVYAREDDPAAPDAGAKPAATPDRTATASPRPSSATSAAPARRESAPSRRSPSEPATRVATDAEKAAFARPR